MSAHGVVSRFYGADTYVWDQDFSGLQALITRQRTHSPTTMREIGDGVAFAISMHLDLGRFNHFAATVTALKKMQASEESKPAKPDHDMLRGVPIIVAHYLARQFDEKNATDGDRVAKREHLYKTLHILGKEPELLAQVQAHLKSRHIHFHFSVAAREHSQDSRRDECKPAPAIVTVVNQGKLMAYLDDTMGQRSAVLRNSPEKILLAAADREKGGSFRQAACVLCGLFEGLTTLHQQKLPAGMDNTIRNSVLQLRKLITPSPKSKTADTFKHRLRAKYDCLGATAPQIWRQRAVKRHTPRVKPGAGTASP